MVNFSDRIKIRLEQPGDYHAVESLTREAFWAFWEPNRQICDEHLLVHRLRKVPSFVPELDFVAELDGKLAGHIIYTKSRIEDSAGKSYKTLTFGPLSVLPEFQNMGIGRVLMRHSFEEAKRLGYRAILIFGHPDYYPRVGFRRAKPQGFLLTQQDGKDVIYELEEFCVGASVDNDPSDPWFEEWEKLDEERVFFTCFNKTRELLLVETPKTAGGLFDGYDGNEPDPAGGGDTDSKND